MADRKTRLGQSLGEHNRAQLTFVFRPEARNALRELPPLRKVKSGPSRRNRLSSDFYDCRAQGLRSNNLLLGVHGSGRRFLQSLRSKVGQVGAAVIRRERSSPVPTREPLIDAFEDEEFQPRLSRCNGRDLEPAFRSKIERTTRRLDLGDGDDLTLDIDVGELVASSNKMPIREMTLSLHSGPLDRLFDLALQLQSTLPLRLSTETWAERGLALSSGKPPTSCKAHKLVLSSKATVEEAFARIAQHCLEHLLANEACVLESEDPEGVHQMRIALRRLRSAFRIFRPILRSDRAKSLNADAKFLADQLGAARDWDVFKDELLKPVFDQLTPNQAYDYFRDRVEAIREESWHQARQAIGSDHYTRFVLEISSWLTQRDGLASEQSGSETLQDKSLLAFASGRLSKLHWRVEKAGLRFEHLPVPERHQMRVDVKRLRYACEFFGSLYRGKARQYSKQLAHLQDALGYLNDVAVAEESVTRLCESCTAAVVDQCRYAGGIVIGWHSHALAASESNLIKSVEGFLDSEPFWPEPQTTNETG